MSGDDTQLSTHGKTHRFRPHYHFLDKGHPEDYRRKEVQALVQAILARENRLAIGLPGMGVSNLLRFLVARAELFKRDAIFAYLDCDTLADASDLEAFFDAVAEQLNDQGWGGRSTGIGRGYGRLKRLVTEADGDPLGRVVVVADQADALLTAAAKPFYQRLKALTDLNKRVCYIFAASPRSADVADPDNLLFAGRRLVVGQLDQRDCIGAITEEEQRLEAAFDVATQAQLVLLSGGHPGLLRALSSAAAEGALGGLDAEATVVERLLARGDVQYRCQKLWDALGPDPQAALRLLGAGRSGAVATERLAWLREFGLVEAVEGGYRLFSPIFERFVAAQSSRGSPLEPVLIMGASTILKDGQAITVAGKVFKGSQEVRVAPLELRLIACLKRERKIYAKDDIAAYVYYEDAGIVPDGALENLVRQVRKRLGAEYIKTHWGQGYEFMG
jgi:hypothetical protein